MSKTTIAAKYPGFFNARGNKLVHNKVEATVKKCLLHNEPHTLLSQEILHDSVGKEGTEYIYQAVGRKVSLFVYSDNSWIMLYK